MRTLYYVLVLCYCYCPNTVRSVSEIFFVGVFPIHGKSGNAQEPCGDFLMERGLQRMEAMYLTIDLINANSDLLHDIVVKPLFIDSCDQPNLAVERFVKEALTKFRGTSGLESCHDTTFFSDKEDSLYAGVIGGASSSVSMELGNLLRLFKVPQISYASTSELLNDPIRYEYFTRTVPPDTQQVDAMLDLASSLGWSSFSIVYSEGSYGESAFEYLKRMTDLKADDYCLMNHFKVNSQTNFTTIVDTLQRPVYKTTTVIILFCNTEHIGLFLNALYVGHHFVILASDSWGNKQEFLKTEHIKSVAHGALTFKLRAPRVNRFIEYFQGLNATNNARNEWFLEYLESIGCSVKNSLGRQHQCAGRIFHYDDKVPYVMDAVYALAYSLDRIYREKCKSQDGICKHMGDQLGTNLMKRLNNLTYPSVFGSSMLNDNGSVNTGYDVLRYDAKTSYRCVATWNRTLVNIRTFPYSASRCFTRCNSYETRVPKQNGYPKCCYDCVRCPKNTYKANGKTNILFGLFSLIYTRRLAFFIRNFSNCFL